MTHYWTALDNNKEWVFSGIGVFFLSGIVAIAIYTWRYHGNTLAHFSRRIFSTRAIDNSTALTKEPSATNLELLKPITNILFVDDDTSFRVISILRTEGWINTRIIRDVGALSDEPVSRAHILFIDINGVGKELGFREEGLGLAQAIKERFPSKKVIIYSADTRAERFHPAWKLADEYLAKNSDPYEFQQIVEQCAREVHA